MNTTDCKTQPRPVLKAYDYENEAWYLYQPRCKMWECAPCAHQNRREWMSKVRHGIIHYQEVDSRVWQFVTVTMSAKLTTFNACVEVWPKNWKLLHSRLGYRSKNFRYVLLPEQHQDGRMHIHMLTNHPANTRWYKDNCAECGLGYMDEAEELEGVWQAVVYVSKYITKTLDHAEWPKKFRRIRTSVNWPDIPAMVWPGKLVLDWAYYGTHCSDSIASIASQLELSTNEKVRVVK